MASELIAPICHSNECQIGSFSFKATICINIIPMMQVWVTAIPRAFMPINIKRALSYNFYNITTCYYKLESDSSASCYHVLRLLIHSYTWRYIHGMYSDLIKLFYKFISSISSELCSLQQITICQGCDSDVLWSSAITTTHTPVTSHKLISHIPRILRAIMILETPCAINGSSIMCIDLQLLTIIWCNCVRYDPL